MCAGPKQSLRHCAGCWHPCCCLVGATAGLLFVCGGHCRSWFGFVQAARRLGCSHYCRSVVSCGGHCRSWFVCMQVARRLGCHHDCRWHHGYSSCPCCRQCPPPPHGLIVLAGAQLCLLPRSLAATCGCYVNSCCRCLLAPRPCRTAKLSVCTAAATSDLLAVLLTELCCCCRWPGGVAGVPLSSHSGTLPQVHVQYTL